jgi:hypothetical protein
METPRGEPLLAIALALPGWVPLFLAIGMAIAGAGVRPIALCLIVAGAFSVPAVIISVLGFARTRGAGQLLSALAFAIAGALTGTIIFWATALS